MGIPSPGPLISFLLVKAIDVIVPLAESDYCRICGARCEQHKQERCKGACRDW